MTSKLKQYNASYRPIGWGDIPKPKKGEMMIKCSNVKDSKVKVNKK